METGLSTRGAEKPAGLVISAVEVNPCIRASPRIPIVHAGPALGLQGISTGFPELKPNTGAGAGGAGHEVQVQVQTSTGSTQEQVLRNDIAGTTRAQVQVQVQMTGKCSIAARAAPSKQELKTSHPGPLTRNRMAAIAVDVRAGECTGPRVTPPRGSREMVKPEASSTIPTIGRMQVGNQNSDSSTLKGVHQTTKRALENRGGLVNRKESVNTGRSEINKRSETIRRLVNRFRLVNQRRSVNTMRSVNKRSLVNKKSLANRGSLVNKKSLANSRMSAIGECAIQIMVAIHRYTKARDRRMPRTDRCPGADASRRQVDTNKGSREPRARSAKVDTSVNGRTSQATSASAEQKIIAGAGANQKTIADAGADADHAPATSASADDQKTIADAGADADHAPATSASADDQKTIADAGADADHAPATSASADDQKTIAGAGAGHMTTTSASAEQKIIAGAGQQKTIAEQVQMQITRRLQVQVQMIRRLCRCSADPAPATSASADDQKTIAGADAETKQLASADLEIQNQDPRYPLREVDCTRCGVKIPVRGKCFPYGNGKGSTQHTKCSRCKGLARAFYRPPPRPAQRDLEHISLTGSSGEDGTDCTAELTHILKVLGYPRTCLSKVREYQAAMVEHAQRVYWVQVDSEQGVVRAGVLQQKEELQKLGCALLIHYVARRQFHHETVDSTVQLQEVLDRYEATECSITWTQALEGREHHPVLGKPELRFKMSSLLNGRLGAQAEESRGSETANESAHTASPAETANESAHTASPSEAAEESAHTAKATKGPVRKCAICLEVPPKDPYWLECAHVYCYVCIHTHFKNSDKCPVCRHPVSSEFAKPSETDAAVQHVDISGAEWARLYGGQPRNRRRNIDEINVEVYDPRRRCPNVVHVTDQHSHQHQSRLRQLLTPDEQQQAWSFGPLTDADIQVSRLRRRPAWGTNLHQPQRQPGGWGRTAAPAEAPDESHEQTAAPAEASDESHEQMAAPAEAQAASADRSQRQHLHGQAVERKKRTEESPAARESTESKRLRYTAVDGTVVANRAATTATHDDTSRGCRPGSGRRSFRLPGRGGRGTAAELRQYIRRRDGDAAAGEEAAEVGEEEDAAVVANRAAAAATHNDANGGNGTTTAVPSRARRDEETIRAESNHHGAEHRGSWSMRQPAFSGRHEESPATRETTEPKRLKRTAVDGTVVANRTATTATHNASLRKLLADSLAPCSALATMTVVANRIATAATHNDANGGNGTTTAVPSRARRDEETTRTESNHHGAEHRGSWSREQSAFSSRHEVTLDTSVTALPAPQPVQDDRVYLVRSIMIATRAVTQDEVDRIDTRSNRACGAATTMIRMRNRGTAAVVKHLMTVVGRGLFSTKRVTALAEQICTAATPRWTQDQVQEIARLFPAGTDGKMWMYITALQKYTAQALFTTPAQPWNKRNSRTRRPLWHFQCIAHSNRTHEGPQGL